MKMKKVTDTGKNIALGGRVDSYWKGRQLKKSGRYNISKPLTRRSKVESAEIIAKRYRLKGFEFGNYVNNNDRTDKILSTRASLEHLSKIIGSKNLGLSNTLGIALGARGYGGVAKAHFEPDYFMINLTKDRSVGSLAHEYGHALDYFFGRYIDQNKYYSSLSGGSSVAKALPKNTGGILRILMNEILDKIMASNSYVKLLKVTGNTEYWRRRNEIFARTFEQWVQFQLKSKGIKNTFLSKNKYESVVYLSKKDFESILPLMNELIRVMRLFMNKKRTTVKVSVVEAKKVAD